MNKEYNKNSKIINKARKCGNINRAKDVYAYDFVPELAHVLNIDEQKEKVDEMENIEDTEK